jgi:hypothetical protein
VIHIQLQCATAEELKHDVLALASILGSNDSKGQLSVATTVDHHLGVTLPTVKTGEDVKIPAPTDIKDSKKSKAKTKAAAPAEEQKTETLPPTEPKVEEKAPEAVAVSNTELLQQVNAKFGISKCREVLAEFKCQRLGELKEENFAAFRAACEKVLG